MTSRNLAAGLVAGAFASVALAGSAHAATIVNCIGEQTTITAEGVTAPTDLWPQQLGMLLGTGYTVNNDGVNAGTVIAGTAKSASSLTGPPNIVVIGPYAEHDYAASITLAMWQTAYKNLVDAYLALTPQPTIYVMTPPPAAFKYQSVAEQTFATSIVKPAVLAVAAGDNTGAKTLKVIDLFDDAFLGTAAAQPTAADGHLSPAGHKEIAQLAYKCIAMGVCGAAGTTTGAGGTGGGAGGAGGATGAGGTTGTAGAGGATGTGGTTGAAGVSGTAGASGTTGTAGTGGTTTGTAGTGGTTTGTAGTGGTTTGTAGTGGTTTGTAGTGGTTTGTAGTGGTTTGTGGSSTGSPQRSSGGGCTIASTGAAGGLATIILGLAILVRTRRRRPS